MKVLHINTHDSGGAFIAAYRFHIELIKRGVQSKFLVLKKYEHYNDIEEFIASDRSALNKIMESIKYRFLNFLTKKLQNKVSPKNGLISLPFSPYDIAKHRLVKEADIIHLHYVSRFLDYPTFFRKVKKPILWTLHDTNPFRGYLHYYFLNEKLPYDAFIQKLKIKYLKKSSVNFLAPSIWMNDQINKVKSQFSLKNVNNIIHNGIDTDLYNQKEKNNLRFGPTFGTNAYNLYDHRKGHSYLIDVVKLIDFKIPVQCLFIGATISGETEQINLHKNLQVSYTGFLRTDMRLSDVYNEMDFFVLTSLADNLPNVILEAMACALPVVAFDVGGIKDLVINGKTGFLIEPFDTASFSEKIRLLLENQNLRKKMGNEARKFVLENFDIKYQTKQYIEIYKNVCC